MRLHWLLPTIKGIPVLMYHRIWPGLSDGLTLTPEQLRAQWLYLKSNGYSALSLTHFLSIAEGHVPAPEKAVLLTFDDGYANNLTYMYPLLQELGWCATLFIIGDTLEGPSSAEGENNPDTKLTIEQLSMLDPAIVQLGFHGYHHENFSEISIPEVAHAIQKSITAFEKAKLPYHPALAYPYGARPKSEIRLRQMKDVLKQTGIRAAFRIGNKLQQLPSRDIFEILRIDIRGEDTLENFKIKLRKGKLKPF